MNKQSHCKNCKYYYGNCQCDLLLHPNNWIHLPCDDTTMKKQLISRINKIKGVKIITVIRFYVGAYMPVEQSNVIDSCSLNKGNCQFYKKKWYKFWIA